VRQLARYFGRCFIAARVPQIVRTPGNGLAGKTVLEVLAEGRIDRVYAYLERLFSYARIDKCVYVAQERGSFASQTSADLF
jgi:hypothetical protein